MRGDIARAVPLAIGAALDGDTPIVAAASMRTRASVSPLRILQLIPTLEGGGAERQLGYLGQGLARLGHRVDVAILRDGVEGARVRQSGAVVHELGWRPAFDPTLVAMVAALIRRTGAQVVQTWQRRMDVAGGLAALMLGRPWIYSERTIWQVGGLRQRLRGRLVTRAATVVANSQAAALHWRHALGDDRRVVVIPNALPLDEIAATPPCPRMRLGVADGAELIVFVGRLVRAKLGVLWPALAQLLHCRPRAVAVLCGDGDERVRLADAISRAGWAARCRLLGYRPDAWALMRAADVLVSASEHEGLPNAVAEAMAAGCPTVLSDIAAHRELAGPSALYFPVGAPALAAAALARTLDDPPAARARAQVARARLADRSILDVARGYAALYARLLRV
jgi:glycosyltransferase involved in cell wall biosynthesis